MSGNAAKGSQAVVDVVIPCYQYGRFLRECVTSVLTQEHQDARVLIIDNASTDNSVEVAQQLAAEDRRVELVARRRNLGLHASWNEGIDWASSRYFMVLCADDFLVPGGLAAAVSIMERHAHLAFAFGHASYVRSEHPMAAVNSHPRKMPWRIVTGWDLIERFCREGVNHVPGSGVLVRTAAQKLAGYYRPELPHTTDFEMWMRLARLGGSASTEAQMVILRLHRSAMKALGCPEYACERPPAQPWRDEAAFDSFFAHEGASLPGAARLHRLAKRGLAERAYWAAVAHLCRGHRSASKDLFKFALRRRPSTAILPPVSYLFRREYALERILETTSEMLRWPRGATKSPARANS
jgi:cellulose synthase/poly-beta-1,6-N-acetylglucosamine synthase-like glycosyltransferase